LSDVTGTLDVVTSQGVETHQWNGNVEDRNAARAAFESLMKTGSYLAVVHDSPGKSHQVRSFDEVEQVEREKGVVEAQISPALVGG
jgi:hypothetical protein